LSIVNTPDQQQDISAKRLSLFASGRKKTVKTESEELYVENGENNDGMSSSGYTQANEVD
jgi:hypothetical protein